MSLREVRTIARKMFARLLTLFAFTAVVVNVAIGAAVSTDGVAASSCTLTASGSDDGPALLAAMANSACSTVVVPASTTLNIETRLNMTGVQDKNLVSLPRQLGLFVLC